MFAGDTHFDERDAFLHSHIGQWVLLKWRGCLFEPPQKQAFGSHLASFILCPFGSEVRGLNYCWLYRSDDGRVFRVGEPLTGINSTWFFKYSTLKDFQIASLSSQDVNFLGLPDLNKELHADVTQPILEIRNDPRFLPFRHPGFPDDVSAVCGPDCKIPGQDVTLRGEQVWIRLTNRDADCRFSGILLNQPQFHDYKKGDAVCVHLLESKTGLILACTKPIKPNSTTA